jgi:V/A-type H+-transporting ATPase subunit A
MGYHVALMADSTSRWAEALREISGRLEEMPAEEGFPAYLPSRISQFYERAGYVDTLSERSGSVSIVGAISPQGADFSEPVTQNTKRFVRAFWALDKELAYARHYAAINWNLSYSEYINDLSKWYNKNISTEFLEARQKFITILAEENKLMEIVKLIGKDVLPDDQKLVLEIARVIRVGYLQQNAFHKDDTFVPLEKQLKMMKLILYLERVSQQVLKEGKAFSLLLRTNMFEKVIKVKYEVPNDNLDLFEDYYKMIDEAFSAIK